MTINITSRHADISDTQKAHVHTKLAAVLEAYPEVEYAHVIMDTQKFRHIIEVVVQGKHHLRIEAKEESDDMYASVDKVADKVDRQLRRFTAIAQFADDLNESLREDSMQQYIADHPEKELLAYVQTETAKWLAHIVPEEADKHVMLAAWNMVNCIAFVTLPGSMATSRRWKTG